MEGGQGDFFCTSDFDCVETASFSCNHDFWCTGDFDCKSNLNPEEFNCAQHFKCLVPACFDCPENDPYHCPADYEWQ
jgi:hypothetical protein